MRDADLRQQQRQDALGVFQMITFYMLSVIF
jgi:hypothetical protein